MDTQKPTLKSHLCNRRCAIIEAERISPRPRKVWNSLTHIEQAEHAAQEHFASWAGRMFAKIRRALRELKS
jgi:hypothetical protein